MSQDTFEVILSCMSLDPMKRSLSGVREALVRAVTFTTFDETLDDFCNVSHRTIASANREPLRTPSIQSPQVEHTSFPWAKALHASPQQASRQLSVIPDTESYTEDLFPSSEESNKDWFSVGAQTPSMASMLESSLGTSMKSLAIRRPLKKTFPRADLTPVYGSLPISMTKPMPLPSMASIFGRKHEQVSRSWSDLVDEDLEEEEHERELRERQEKNARTWSHESKNEDIATSQSLSEISKSSSFVNIGSANPGFEKSEVNDIDSDTVTDGFFFQDTPTRQGSPPRYSPPSKRTNFDKWAALGDRRRAYTGSSSSEKSPDGWRGRRNTGNSSMGFSFGTGVYDNRAGKDRIKEKASTGDLGDLEWVGGWSDCA